MLDLLNGGALAVMISVGHRTGLFDALAELDAATSQELADAAGLDERYVREWLGAMTTGRIVEFDPDDGRYSAARRSTPPGSPGRHRPTTSRSWRSRSRPLGRRGRHRRVLPEGRRRPLRALRALPRGDGRGERADRPLGAVLAHPAARPRHGRAARGGSDVLDLGCGRGRALAACSPSGFRRAVPRLRPLPRGDRLRAGRGAERGLENVGFEQRDLSTFDVDAEPEALRSRDDVRRRPRPGAPARAAEGHPPALRPTAST